MKTIILIIFSLFSLNIIAANYNVATDGSGDYTTISQVNSASFSPGDSIFFNRGDTWAETFTIPSSGSSGNPIFFGAYGTGADPIITGSDTRTPVIHVNNNSYIIIDNITIEHCASDPWHGAIRTGTTSTVGVVIQNCTIQDNRGSGISLQGSSTATSVTIDNCIIQNNGQFGILISDAFTSGEIKDCQILSNGGYADTDAQQFSNIQGNLSNFEIHGNTIYNAAPGTTTKLSESHGIYSSSATTITCNIYNNTIYGNLAGAGIKARYSVNVYNNLIYNNGYTAISLGGNGTTNAVYNVHHNITYGSVLGYGSLSVTLKGSGTLDANIYNNTFYKSGDAYNSTKEVSISDNLTSLNVKNNIFYAADGRGGIRIDTTQSNADIDYNLYWKDTESGVPNNMYNGTTYTTLAEWQALGFDTNGVNENPDLVNPTSDFRLQSGSPAIDAGVDVGLTTVGLPDIGAYEFGTSAPIKLQTDGSNVYYKLTNGKWWGGN